MAAIPWETVNQHNYCDEQRIENDFLELLLLCPSAAEHNEFREYLKGIKTKINMPHKLNEIQKEAIEEQIIKRNLKKLVLPDFKDVIKTWRDVKKIKTSLPELIKRVSKQPFAPQETDTFDIAYERLLMARKFESSQYFYLLMDNWKHHLRKAIFDGSCWPVAKQQHFFDVWEKALFKKTIPPLIPMKMRWKQAQSIDLLTGGKIVKYFSDLFVSNENSIDGQVVCILWTLIAISRQLQSNQASIKLIDVINLSRTNVNIKNRSLRLNDKEIEISKGLTAIFAILIDIKYGKRELRLFPDITVDRLEDALKRASKNIFVNETILITPQAFLTFPHSFEGVRIAPRLLQGMCVSVKRAHLVYKY